MNKKEQILIKNVIDNLYKNKPSNFLDNKEFRYVVDELNKRKIKYNVFNSYKECDRVIVYKEILPDIKLFKISSNNLLKHSDVLGSLYNMQIDMSLIGDIIISNEIYIVVKDSISEYLKYNLRSISKYNIELVEVDIDLLNSYEKKYEVIELIVPSLRMDTIVSKITHISRSKINEIFLKKEVILNYEILDNFCFLKENDVFSIRKYGKYRYVGIKCISKSGNKIIIINKYV